MTATGSPPTTEPLLVTRDGAVTILTFNRPERHNAWNEALDGAYREQLRRADADPGVRAIVVTGAGRSFCVGADLDEVATAADTGAGRLPSGHERSVAMRVRKPVIAAINGAAAGLGLVQALYCDVRISTPAAKLTTAFARRGLIAEYGIAWLLPRLIGTGRAGELLLSGSTLLGNEGHALGLVDRLADPDELLDTSLAYAHELADNCSPVSMHVIKGQLQRAMTQTWSEALSEADELLARSLEHPDVTEGVSSYLERRPAAFAALPTEER